MRISVSEPWSALQRNIPSHIALFSAVVTEMSFLPMERDINYIVVLMFSNTDMNKLFSHESCSLRALSSAI